MGRRGVSKVLGRLTLLACDLLPGTRTDNRRLNGSAAMGGSRADGRGRRLSMPLPHRRPHSFISTSLETALAVDR